jgi:plastocyanin
MVSFKAFLAVTALSTAVSALPRPGQTEAPSYGTTSAERVSSQTSSTADVKPTQYEKSGEYGTSHEYPETSAAQHSSASYPPPTYSAPAYGSGKSNWGDYEDCVSQCIADYGAPPSKYTPPPAEKSNDSGSGGPNYTIIVAPAQGVLRFVPSMATIPVGTTVEFVWNASNHTVSKGSSLEPCNKTADAFFTSGIQVQNFTFTQVINNTDPLYIYCAVGMHCKNGMFAMINPPTSAGSPTSIGSMMDKITSENPDLAAYASYSRNQTSGNAKVSNWGSDVDMSALPEWSHKYVIENTLYMRNFLAMNEEVLKDGGVVDLSESGTTPLMIPADVASALNNAAAVSAPASTSSASGTSSAPSEATSAASNAAGSVTVSRFLVASIAALVTLLAF